MKRPLKRMLSNQPPSKRLRATAQRATAKYAPDEHEVEEPNVKLSRAFIIVLLLHVVAVGGIFAFSALKDRQQGGSTASKGRSGGSRESLQANAATATNQNELTPAVNATHRVKPGETLATIAMANGLSPHDLELANNLKPGAALIPGKDLVVPEKTALRPVPLNVQKLVENPKTASTPRTSNNAAPDKSSAGLGPDKGPEEGSRSYVVQRGDTPALIAKRLKVSAAELLKLNNIQDPRKLQVCQKLAVP